MKKSLGSTLVFLTFLLATSTAAAQTTAAPGEETVIDQNISQNIISSNPFEAEKQGEKVVISPGLEFEPGTYTEEIEYSNSSKDYEISILEVANFNLTTSNYTDTVEIGESGQITDIAVDLQGNTNVNMDLSVAGNLSDFFSTTDSMNVVPGVQRNIVLSYSVPDNVEFGTYTGNLTASYKENSSTADLRIEFVDNIDPEIIETNISSYEATVPEDFEVQADDNFELEQVRASIEEEYKVNDSVQNRTFKDIRFDKLEDSNERFKWSPDIEEPGKYWITVFAEDKAGNTVNRTESFEVSELDAVKFENDQSLDLPVYRTDSTIEEKIGEIEEDTEVTFQLQGFSEDLQSETGDWQIGIFTDSEGYQYFNNGVNDTVTFSENASVKLVIEGTMPTSFNGDIGIQGIPQHREIQDLNFNGEFLDCPVPIENEFEAYNRNITLQPRSESDLCGESGWNLTYPISADEVSANTNLKEEIDLLTPQGVREQHRMFQEQVLEQKNSSISTWQTLALFFVVTTGLGAYASWLAVYEAPYIMHVSLKNRDLRERQHDLSEKASKLKSKGAGLTSKIPVLGDKL
jgi:hypothetical protein